jgi:flagellar motor switch protein FliN
MTGKELNPPVDPSADAPAAPDSSAVAMPDMGGEAAAGSNPYAPERNAPVDPGRAIGMLGDVDLDVKIELGRCRMLVGDVLRLNPGSVVELDKLAGDPVDVYVNERLVARGEVLVVNDNFCVRINDILSTEV